MILQQIKEMKEKLKKIDMIDEKLELIKATVGMDKSGDAANVFKDLPTWKSICHDATSASTIVIISCLSLVASTTNIIGY
jgi:hypothetical protein